MRNRIVLFSKKDCQPCLMVKAWLENNKLDFIPADPFSEPNLARLLNVKSVPTVVIVQMDDGNQEGQVLFRTVGFKPDELETLKQYQNE